MAVRCAVLLISLLVCQQAVVAQDVDELLDRTAKVRSMTEQSLINLVPLQSGLRYVGCPNCTSGRQEGQLTWTIDRPDGVFCRYCQHRYPSERYPMSQSIAVSTPGGHTARFDYWADDKGYRYFFNARRDDEVREYLAQQTLNLARLYELTRDSSYARRASLLLDRFAEVYPDWCFHFDYPFQQKIIYDGLVPPADFRDGYRTARWNWWAYMDIPEQLVQAFQLVRNSGALEQLAKEKGVNVADRIRRDLLYAAGEQVAANRESYSNMSPTAWRGMLLLGRAIGEPKYVHDVVRRIKTFVDRQFFYDGTWYEGAPSYGAQTLSGLRRVLDELRGYSDPPGYTDAIDGNRFDAINLNEEFPLLEQARLALEKLQFPDGRLVPINDTWAQDRSRRSRGGPNASPTPGTYLLPALGHACLNVGSDRQGTQFHLSWSGGYGHQHADALNLIVYSRQRELLSDIGYSHTAYRSWTIATVAHNTIVIDGMSQAAGSVNSPSDGRLLLYDTSDPKVQVVSADGLRAYPNVAQLYRRTLVVLNATDAQTPLAVDVFEVQGGRTHDFFLHGDADRPTVAAVDRATVPLQSLLPTGFDWKPTTNEGETRQAYVPYYPYGFLKNLQSAEIDEGELVQVDFKSPGETVGLRAHLLADSHSQLIVGTNPSIRQAGEDDSQLENFHRPFALLRRNTQGETSQFISVIEPFVNRSVIQSVSRLKFDGEAIVLKIRASGQTSFVVLGAKQEVNFVLEDGTSPAEFKGSVGVLQVNDQGEVLHGYAIGDGGWTCGTWRLRSHGPHRAALKRVDGRRLLVVPDAANPSTSRPAVGSVVRLLTDDGWTYPFHVVDVDQQSESLTIEVAEGPCLSWDPSGRILQLLSFPQRQHTGLVQIEWESSVASR